MGLLHSFSGIFDLKGAMYEVLCMQASSYVSTLHMQTEQVNEEETHREEVT